MLDEKETTLEKLFPQEGEKSGVERSICIEEGVSGLPDKRWVHR